MGIFMDNNKKKINIKISPEILKLIAEIDEFKGQWLSLGKIAAEKLKALNKIAAIESIGSSTRIEGVKLSDAEIEALLSNIEIKSFRSRDEEEVVGYAEVLKIISESYNDMPFTENYIKQLHSILLKYSSKDEHHKGEYKKVENHVEAFDEKGKSLGVVFQTASPFETPGLMKELIEQTDLLFSENKFHPLLVISYFNIHFLAIHPFQDGNGRLSRILTNLLLLKNDYTYIAYTSLEHIIEENKDKYYIALRKSQKNIRKKNEDISIWTIFFLECMKKQKDILKTKIIKEQKLDILPEISEKIIQFAKEYGKITNAKIAALLGYNRNTIKIHLKNLVHSNHLEKFGKGKGTYYTLKR